jgi:NAD(P)-dependent dehydrogenase (short-subunit alcohol dehydrogenase family)
MRPVDVTTRSFFITARAAARHMIRRRSGVILAFGGYGDPWPNLGGLQVSFQAVEALRRGLSVELGPHGIRVVTLQTNGIAESISDPEFRGKIEAGIVANTMLERGATLDDVGNAAVFAASDWARTVTASKINITCGGFVD